MDQLIGIQISHHQIQVRSVPFVEDNVQWNDESLEQGVLINRGHVIFDPIVDGEFFAKVNISLRDTYVKDVNALRAMVVPFDVVDLGNLFVASVITRHQIGVGLVVGEYSIYFEICEPDDVDEVYYNIVFVPGKIGAKYLMDDNFGGVENGVLYLTS